MDWQGNLCMLPERSLLLGPAQHISKDRALDLLLDSAVHPSYSHMHMHSGARVWVVTHAAHEYMRTHMLACALCTAPQHPAAAHAHIHARRATQETAAMPQLRPQSPLRRALWLMGTRVT